MQRFTIEVGAFEVNASIVHDGRSAYVIDPGGEAARIAGILREKGLELKGMLLTHAHFDHIGGVSGLEAEFPGAWVFVPEGDLAVYTHPMNQMPPDYPPARLPKNLVAKPEIEGLQVIDTPGHTPGGVSYYFPADRTLFSGDTLFAGSVGRTDLPGGDMAVLVKSLEKLKALDGDTLVIPGHGPVTSIAAEVSGNPFL